MSDLYPQETVSMNALPEDCPLKLLDYGILTELIQDNVISSRRKFWTMKKDDLVKKLELKHLKNCLYELDRLGKSDPSIKFIDLYRKKSLVSTKGKIKTYLDTNFVPLVYLEEALDIQKRGHCNYEIGDRVKIKRDQSKRREGDYGIISSITGSGRTKEYQVDLVENCSYLEEDGKYEFYPNFLEMYIKPSGPYSGQVTFKCNSGWDLEFVGKENEASQRLRQKFKEDNEESHRRRQVVWEKLQPYILEEYIERICINYRGSPASREIIIESERQLILREQGQASSDITDDELFMRRLNKIVKRRHMVCIKRLWFRKGVNVLDKGVWENVNDVDNPLYKIWKKAKEMKRFCGFRMILVQNISAIIKKHNLLD